MTIATPDVEQAIDMGFTPEKFPLGTHMCYLYSDEDERRAVMAQFTNRGLEEGEFVGYFANLEDKDRVDSYLSAMGVHLPEAAQQANTLFTRAQDVYCPGQHFSPAATLQRLRTLQQNCQHQGGQALRVTGEMAWALSPAVTGVESLVEYEARVNLLMKTHPLTAICQYDTNRFDGATIFEILKVHPMMVVRGQVVHNPYYMPARDYLTSHGFTLDDG
jgi:hypothetical protein